MCFAPTAPARLFLDPAHLFPDPDFEIDVIFSFMAINQMIFQEKIENRPYLRD